jgi:hypothetical protein
MTEPPVIVRCSSEKCTDHGGTVSGSNSCWRLRSGRDHDCARTTSTTATVPVTTSTTTATQPGSPSGVFVDAVACRAPGKCDPGRGGRIWCVGAL